VTVAVNVTEPAALVAVRV
jgi:hypothetical protein